MYSFYSSRFFIRLLLLISVLFLVSCGERSIVDVQVEIPTKRVVVDDGLVNIQPAWHPLGQKIIYTATPSAGVNSGQAGAINEIVLETGKTKVLVDESLAASYPSYSPDGQNILFCADRDGTRDVLVASLADNRKIKINEKDGISACPRWSPDGNFIAYLIDGQLVLYDVVGKQNRYISNIPLLIANLSWTPNGKEIVFAARAEDNAMQLFLYNLQQRSYEALTPRVVGTWPSTSNLNDLVRIPSAWQIVYERGNAIFAFFPQEGFIKKIVSSGQMPAISPDGTSLAYSVDGKIVIESVWVKVNG